MRAKKLVYICDWLPPDFGAVGQYAMFFASEWAKSGWAVTLVGLTSAATSQEAPKPIGDGQLEIIRVHRPLYEKQRFAERLIWTLLSNLLLLKAGWRSIRQADAILFTGSPPLLLHFIAPLNLILRSRLIYRITDFHPECLIAERGRADILARILLCLTLFWRRRVQSFEVLGLDQARRLEDIGIPPERICLKRDPCPIAFPSPLVPAPLPQELGNASGVILYSGNWGIAHDEETFIQAYSEYAKLAIHGLAFWLNAIGSRADRVEQELLHRGTKVYRSKPVPLEQLPALLVAADVHLITLRDPFVGYVVPSKIYGCIESGKMIIFVGSESSDVHLLAKSALPPEKYYRVEVGDVPGLVKVLHDVERILAREGKSSRPLLLRNWLAYSNSPVTPSGSDLTGT